VVSGTNGRAWAQVFALRRDSTGSTVAGDDGSSGGTRKTEPVLVRPNDASKIARLIFVVDTIPKHERDRVRRDLLDCCHRDALAMVRLVETLEGLARVAP
jgi:hypothetical protein